MSARDLILRVQLAWYLLLGVWLSCSRCKTYIPGGWVTVCACVLLASSCCVRGDWRRSVRVVMVRRCKVEPAFCCWRWGEGDCCGWGNENCEVLLISTKEDGEENGGWGGGVEGE